MIGAVALTFAISGASAISPRAPPPSNDDLLAYAERIQPGGRLLLGYGERAVVRFDAEMRPILVSLDKVDPASVTRVRATVDEGPVVFTLGGIEGERWVLKVENGLSTDFGYGALVGILEDGGYALATTSTCVVRTRLNGLEVWSDPLAMVLLGPFGPAAPGDLSCDVRAELPEG